MKKPLLDTSLLAVPFKGAAGIKEVCFIGIGGIGMSALARFFLEQGVAVTGYDKTRTMLTAQLEEAGMQIHYKDSLEYLSRGADIVVYTPAIPTDHLELNWYRDNGYTVYKRSDLLQRITEGSFNICIAGTHGKTTTSTLVAHILRYSGIGCNAFLGGIASNYGTNYWSSTTNCCVVEADEYDRSFLKLRPHLALITAMDPDHLDIYGTAEAMEEAFLSFSSLVASGGLLLYKKGLKRTEALRAPQLLSYHLHDTSADCRSIGLRVQEGAYQFDIAVAEDVLTGFRLHMGGLHNVENTVAAVSIAWLLGVEQEKIKEAISNFKGVQRRFELIWKNEQFVLIDDYAHHPAELKALLEGVRSLHGDTPCTIFFQPHLYTRTRDLAAEFGAALEAADQVVLLPIYPARETPLEGVQSELIAAHIKKAAVTIVQKEELATWIKNDLLQHNKQKKVYITAGAGDIDQLLPSLHQLFSTTCN